MPRDAVTQSGQKRHLRSTKLILDSGFQPKPMGFKWLIWVTSRGYFGLITGRMTLKFPPTTSVIKYIVCVVRLA
jgi:hypothetical protein